MRVKDAQFGFGFLLQRVLGDRLEGLLNIDRFLGGSLKVRNVAF